MDVLDNKCNLKENGDLSARDLVKGANRTDHINRCDRAFDEQKVRENYERLTRLLIEKKLTITTMESATSGLIASLITDTEGASAIIPGAFVTYSNEAKIRQGVLAEVIEAYSVYSRETAAAMAVACRDAYKTSLSVGVTGTFRNVDPSNEATSIPGLVFFAICTPDCHIHTYQINIERQTSRWNYKLATANAVCKEIIELIGS